MALIGFRNKGLGRAREWPGRRRQRNACGCLRNPSRADPLHLSQRSRQQQRVTGMGVSRALVKVLPLAAALAISAGCATTHGNLASSADRLERNSDALARDADF